MRIILDANCLLVSIPRKSKYRLVFDSFLSKKFTLVISNEILSEYIEIISVKANHPIAINIAEMLLIAGNVEKQDIYYKWDLITEDRDDNKYVDCAVASNADFIVTNDKHFNILKEVNFPKVKTITLDQFMSMLKYEER